MTSSALGKMAKADGACNLAKITLAFQSFCSDTLASQVHAAMLDFMKC